MLINGLLWIYLPQIRPPQEIDLSGSPLSLPISYPPPWENFGTRSIPQKPSFPLKNSIPPQTLSMNPHLLLNASDTLFSERIRFPYGTLKLLLLGQEKIQESSNEYMAFTISSQLPP